MFPKSGKFKYDFEKGKPWQSENLLAPFNFAILKSDAEITAEKQTVTDNSILYFDIDPSIKPKVENAYAQQFRTVFSDTIPKNIRNNLYKTGQEIIEALYAFGISNESHDFSEKRIIALLDNRVKKQDGFFSDIVKQDAIIPVIETVLSKTNSIGFKTDFFSLFFDIIEPNLTFNKSFTEKALQEAMDKIAYARGSVEKGTLIIAKGEVVDVNNYQILKSLQLEFESQVWSKSSYYWIVFAYTLLVALALLMLFLFLRKYRKEVYENNTKVTFIFFNVLLMIFITTLVVNYDSKFVYVVPICILPLIFKAFFDARLGLFAHVITVLLLCFCKYLPAL
jgi:membrane-associated HD superfamily phosphohydrolase